MNMKENMKENMNLCKCNVCGTVPVVELMIKPYELPQMFDEVIYLCSKCAKFYKALSII